MASFRTETRGDVAVVTFDLLGEPVNTLSPAVGAEFMEELERLGKEEVVKAIVFTSAKQDFVVGADVNWLGSLRSASDGERASHEGQHGFDRLAFFPKPVVAAIHGACLGGGLEWALACRGRVASDAPRTQLGLPEVQLGLLPGAGGTQRLPRLIGLQAALDLILTGRPVRAAKARKLGLVDDVVPPSILVDVAVERARALAAGEGSAPPHRSPRETVTRAALEGNPLGRRVIFAGARKRVLKQTGGHYPAPLRALDVVREGQEKGMEAGLRAESRAFGELLVTEVSARLRELFFATTALKKDTGVDGAAKARPVHKLALLGGGLMGGGIAFVTAERAGLVVRIKERDDASVGRALSHVRRLLEQQVRRRRLDRRGLEKVLARVSGTTDVSGFHRADVVVEAVPEDLDLKRQAPRRRGGRHGRGVHLRLQHQLAPHHPDRRGSPAPGQRHRDALLQPGGEAAPPRGHPPPGHGPLGDCHLRGARQEAGQDGHRRERRPGLLHLAGPRPLPERGGAPPGGRRGDRLGGPGAPRVRLPRRPLPAARRGGLRHRREGEPRAARGVRRADDSAPGHGHAHQAGPAGQEGEEGVLPLRREGQAGGHERLRVHPGRGDAGAVPGGGAASSGRCSSS